MAAKSTIDRVLILAAVVCAAGLVWQLSVLLMGHGAAAHRAELAAAARGDTASPAGPGAARSDPASVRVVYPVEGDAGVPKTTVKALDTPAAPAAPLASSGGAPAPAATIASAPAAPPASASPIGAPPAAQAASSDPAPAALPVAAPPVTQSSLPGPQASFRLPSPAESVAPAPARAPAVQHLASAEAPAPAPVPAKPRASASGQAININNASIEALNHLPGVGHIGNAIASHRPYRSVEDLVKKRVLRRDVYEQIKGQIATE